MKTCIDPLVEAITGGASLPLLAIGSGGSLTAAHLVASLHQQHVGRIAKAVTPLEIVSVTSNSKSTAMMFLSAGGRNADIIGAFQQVVVREPHRLVVMCSRKKSPLSQLAEMYDYVNLFDFNLPVGKDGFLATNSLLAFSILLCRAYAQVFPVKYVLPENFDFLVHPTLTSEQFVAELRRLCLPLWERETIVVLYGIPGHPAAVDLESKFTEAALGSIQMADYRNFAHGRHHWLAKRASTTAVLALVTNDDREIADKTLRFIPDDIPVVRIDIPYSGGYASLVALSKGLYIVGLAGEARSIDPGRPGIPLFGRKIYNLRAFGVSHMADPTFPLHEAVAIERKTETDVKLLVMRGEVDFWRDAYRSFCERLLAMSFRAIVFDYDGTLCDPRDRYTGLSDAVVSQLVGLLEAGILVGIATGRGKSVKDVLRRKIEQTWWSRVVVGYYNGADNGLLSDDTHPDSAEGTCKALDPLAEALQSDGRLMHLAACTYRRMQITVEPKTYTAEASVWDVVQQLVNGRNLPGVTVVRSSHSIDVLAPGVSKRTLVEQVRGKVGEVGKTMVLCIGDRGRWPGNDFALLQEPYSLSVDEVSSDPNTCWNLAPAGHRGVQATLDYLRAMQVLHEFFQIVPDQIGSV
jgi:fructoselysine-6-P-deglycase FrlB-like protein